MLLSVQIIFFINVVFFFIMEKIITNKTYSHHWKNAFQGGPFTYVCAKTTCTLLKIKSVLNLSTIKSQIIQVEHVLLIWRSKNFVFTLTPATCSACKSSEKISCRRWEKETIDLCIMGLALSSTSLNLTPRRRASRGLGSSSLGL